MSDISLSVTISRSELGLSDLELNDGTTYICTPEIEPGQITWRRERVQSPYVDGEFTVSRAKDDGEMRIIVDVLGATHSAIRTSIDTLIDAFTQSTFTLTIAIGGTTYAWTGEAADYAMTWDHVRMIGERVAVGFQFPRKSAAAAGPY